MSLLKGVVSHHGGFQMAHLIMVVSHQGSLKTGGHSSELFSKGWFFIRVVFKEMVSHGGLKRGGFSLGWSERVVFH